MTDSSASSSSLMDTPFRVGSCVTVAAMLITAPCRAQAIGPLSNPPGPDTVILLVGRGVTARVGSLTVSVPPKARDSVIFLTPGRNGSVRYSFAASPGFRNIQVRGGSADGHDAALPPTGVLGGSGSRVLSATSDRIVHLNKENRRLYELTKAMYAAKDPIPGYRKVFCEEMRLLLTLGDTLSRRLITEVDYVLSEEWPSYWDNYRRVQPVLLGVEVAPHCKGAVEKMLQSVR